MSQKNDSGSPADLGNLAGSAVEYLVDMQQRSLLFWDILRQRGNEYVAHQAQKVPNVLNYDFEMILDAREFARPVNYGLVRIKPPAGVTIDPRRRPFIIVDPRAGHGPGIGGFKSDSEIGVALRAGHPCYFIGFSPEPMPGQTIEDVALAEAQFIEKVISLHPDTQEKPCVVGNCQAGWAVMILASVRPELFGPLIIAGAPLSYWAGVHGRNPMRYSGGLLGGTWLTALSSDLGAGKFDGGMLVQNFENMNPANTLWSKQYNVYAKVDTEGPRYLEFERWWGGHVNLNADEIQFIVDELFVGNKLAAGLIRLSDGTEVDLRNIRSPIVVFCSQGDDITPPQQALDWVLDLYDSVEDIVRYGQTIVYTIHHTIGHLGIFVSGGIARKEHAEFSSNIDLIDLLPPGLYEATFEPKGEALNGDLAAGDWIMRCEARTLDDIRALGHNSPEDERRFATAARVSEINLSLYRTFVQPLVRQWATPQLAEAMRQFSPARWQYEWFSDKNPLMAAVARTADEVRQNRKPVSAANPFLAAERRMSEQIVKSLDAWKETRDAASERAFMAIYGSPALQAAVGVDPEGDARRRPAKSQLHAELLRARIAELKTRLAEGGFLEALIRALIWIGMSRGHVDERGVAALKHVGQNWGQNAGTSVTEFKARAREQYLMLLLEPEAALAAIPSMLPDDPELRRKGLAAIREILSAAAPIAGETANRLARIEAMFAAPAPHPSSAQGAIPLDSIPDRTPLF